MKNLAKRAERRILKLAAQKGAGALLRKAGKHGNKLFAALVFFGDLYKGGPGHAVHGFFWPISDMLYGPSDYEREQIEKELDDEDPVDFSDDELDEHESETDESNTGSGDRNKSGCGKK